MWIQDPLQRLAYNQKAGTLKLAVRSDLIRQRPRKHADGKTLRKKNAQGILQYIVSIVSARYDNSRHSWMYTLNDYANERIAGETEETKLG